MISRKVITNKPKKNGPMADRIRCWFSKRMHDSCLVEAGWPG